MLCNSTRLVVKKLMNNLIDATILFGPHKGEVVLLSCTPLILTDIAFEYRRFQFPMLHDYHGYDYQ